MDNIIRTYTRYGTATETIGPFDISPTYNQLFATVSYYSSSAFTEATLVTPSAGTIEITGRANGAGGYAKLNNSVTADADLLATAPSNVLSTNTPLDSLKCVPSSVAGATHYRLTITAKSV